MTRTTIILPTELANLAKREARRRETSFSEIVRRSLVVQLGVDPKRPRKLSFTGIGKSGQHHVARDADAILKREWLRGSRRR